MDLSPERKKLLIELEYLIGQHTYNPNIKNFGPGGAPLDEGRSFRYPITCPALHGGGSDKYSSKIPPELPDLRLLWSYYAMGANRLRIVRALDEVLAYLEKHHGLVIKGDIHGDSKPAET